MKIRKLTSYLLAGMIATTIISPKMAFAEETTQNVQASANIENKVTIAAKERVSVHDPSIVKDGNEYYVFGSHIEAAKSKDLQNWTKFTNSYTTPNNTLFGDLSKNLAGSFAWAGENDSDSYGGYSVWAPCVFWNNDYINADGTKGAYMMYYCTSSTYKRSDIGYAVAKNIEGPYTYIDTIIYSGFTKGDAYDSKSTKNTNYINTNIKKLIDNGTLSGVNSNWFANDGAYNTSYAPNAIDPELFYDKDGTLWMNYGSWSGGIYMLQINKETGKAIYPGQDKNADSVNPTDRYFGTRIAGGYTKSGEGSEIVYDKENGYYYLYMSYGGLAANGGYNIRLFRAKNSNGPYLDEAGNNAALLGNVDNTYCGIKLIGNYKFDCLDVGYKSAGHNSSFIDSDGQMYLIYHTRFNNGTEEHQVRVHQMFINEEGWPVVAPYEYNGDKIYTSGYSKDDIVGYYQFINHGSENSSKMLNTVTAKLNSDNTITGDITGTWSVKNGSYYMDATIAGVTYKGVFFKQQDESKYENKVMTFTAVGSNNQCIWGSKIKLNDKQAVEFAAKALESSIPNTTKTNITLPKTGALDTTISWSSSNKNSIDVDGKIKRTGNDESTILTAKITKGQAVYTKTFSVTVKGKLANISETPIYKFDFEKLNSLSEVSNSGSKNGNAILKGSASIVKDQNRGKVLNITNNKGAIKANYLALPTDTFSKITDRGYTVGMWVNVNTSDSNYWEHSALFEANGGGQGKYPVTRISANLYGRINANGSYTDATEISEGLKVNTWEYVTYTVNSKGIHVYVNGNEVGSAQKDLAACFKDDFLSNMKDVRVGSGDIWSDTDIAAAKFDNIAIYNTSLTDEEVEALYNQEASETVGK
ncbi:arabinan endo-1,5-alpha-L-arabinosidase [Clostridium saccharoperbutylacetonicum]|uniref:Beta-xylosidase n=1 Tax=Clostridium saccharoperbutylacetonicum N1-4(HMT) TaxID=931276 RepID=M1MNE1_9CLOT|nr:glycoside hydrolase family 43 C-terminal domain-containing protein [Clostridium saccharoperbutylacetonicum]AGF59399.1 beta-xylosidase [Clostridium saccharoperbutylacetonicum N1-4(HMT)]NRT59810.1 arabinan endo-1,5-alpha-L-arabinosidase [Clostridium saccharoperbutylacetonicum]NSB23122.1 arabinan endo-1,5-alpha-L-arabinosidase [Clostridium saccharoperbutylacetonicum]NSB42493.1 arabinan endo-1,5-alpha-L-arabinosidase [Clostridium saccharoperbutylacetonicum]